MSVGGFGVLDYVGLFSFICDRLGIVFFFFVGVVFVLNMMIDCVGQ